MNYPIDQFQGLDVCRFPSAVERGVHICSVGAWPCCGSLPSDGLPKSLEQRARRAVLHPSQVHATRYMNVSIVASSVTHALVSFTVLFQAIALCIWRASTARRFGGRSSSFTFPRSPARRTCEATRVYIRKPSADAKRELVTQLQLGPSVRPAFALHFQS